MGGKMERFEMTEREREKEVLGRRQRRYKPRRRGERREDKGKERKVGDEEQYYEKRKETEP